MTPRGSPAFEPIGLTSGLGTILARSTVTVSLDCLVAVKMDGKLHLQAHDFLLALNSDMLLSRARP